jgi:hypothetical protein
MPMRQTRSLGERVKRLCSTGGEHRSIEHKRCDERAMPPADHEANRFPMALSVISYSAPRGSDIVMMDKLPVYKAPLGAGAGATLSLPSAATYGDDAQPR